MIRLDWNITPYLFTSNHSDAEVDIIMDSTKDEITDDKAVEIIINAGEMESEIQHPVGENQTLVFLTPQKLKTYNQMLKDFGLSFSFVEAGDLIFLGKFDISGACEDFKSLANQYVEKFYTVNDVLDKINLTGMDSLNEVDYAILKK